MTVSARMRLFWSSTQRNKTDHIPSRRLSHQNSFVHMFTTQVYKFSRNLWAQKYGDSTTWQNHLACIAFMREFLLSVLSLVPRPNLQGEGLHGDIWSIQRALLKIHSILAIYIELITNLCAKKVLCYCMCWSIAKDFCCYSTDCFLQCDWQMENSP